MQSTSFLARLGVIYMSGESPSSLYAHTCSTCNMRHTTCLHFCTNLIFSANRRVLVAVVVVASAAAAVGLNCCWVNLNWYLIIFGARCTLHVARCTLPRSTCPFMANSIKRNQRISEIFAFNCIMRPSKYFRNLATLAFNLQCRPRSEPRLPFSLLFSAAL